MAKGSLDFISSTYELYSRQTISGHLETALSSDTPEAQLFQLDGPVKFDSLEFIFSFPAGVERFYGHLIIDGVSWAMMIDNDFGIERSASIFPAIFGPRFDPGTPPFMGFELLKPMEVLTSIEITGRVKAGNGAASFVQYMYHEGVVLTT